MTVRKQRFSTRKVIFVFTIQHFINAFLNWHLSITDRLRLTYKHLPRVFIISKLGKIKKFETSKLYINGISHERHLCPDNFKAFSRQ